MVNIMRTEQVVEATRLSRITLWRLVKRGEFPAPFTLTGRINAWRAEQIEKWLEDRIAA